VLLHWKSWTPAALRCKRSVRRRLPPGLGLTRHPQQRQQLRNRTDPLLRRPTCRDLTPAERSVTATGIAIGTVTE